MSDDDDVEVEDLSDEGGEEVANPNSSLSLAGLLGECSRHVACRAGLFAFLLLFPSPSRVYDFFKSGYRVVFYLLGRPEAQQSLAKLCAAFRFLQHTSATARETLALQIADDSDTSFTSRFTDCLLDLNRKDTAADVLAGLNSEWVRCHFVFSLGFVFLASLDTANWTFWLA